MWSLSVGGDGGTGMTAEQLQAVIQTKLKKPSGGEREAMTDEFQFPALHVTRRFTDPETARQVEEVVTAPICDLCGDSRVCWEYDCDDFELTELEWGSQGGFYTCDPCSELVEKRVWADLVGRVLRSWRVRFGEQIISEESMAGAAAFVSAFFENMHPGRKPVG